MRKAKSKSKAGKLNSTISKAGKKKSERKAEEEHPLARVLDVFLHKCEDIKMGAQVFINVAGTLQEDRQKKLFEQLKAGEQLLEKNDANYAAGIRQTQNAILHLKHLTKSKLPDVIESSLFLSLFSAFDAFTGDLLTSIYKKKAQLLETLSRTVTVSEILQLKSLESFQDTILREEIENFRRKSYPDQFKELENTFGLKLRTFESWPKFVECSQRRNLFTHCDGEVSQQYLDVCDKEGYKFDKRPAVGTQLGLGAKYFLPVCDLVSEVAVKLCHTLWRKIFPDELKKADEELIEVIYERLEFEEYKRARVYSQFALGQQKISSDLHRRIFLINNAIALKFGGASAEATSALKQEDWSACSLDVKIAEAVLLDKFDEAGKLMKKIGWQGEIIKEEAYHTWPLFKEFRTTPQFLRAYNEVYGRPFVVELQKSADAGQNPAAASKAKPKEHEVVN